MKLNKYIVKQILVGFLLVTFSLMSILWLTQSLRFVELVTNKGLPLSFFIQMTSLLMPRLFIILSPIAIFIAALFVFNRMLSDRELIVIKSAGIAPFRTAKPIILVGLLLSLFSFYINSVAIPRAERAFNDLEWQVKNDLTHLLFREGEFTYLELGLTIFITSQEKDGSISGILVNDERDPKTKVTISAERGRVVNVGDIPRIILVNGARQEINKVDSSFSSLSFDRYSIDFGKTTAKKEKEAEAREQSLAELLDAPNNPNLSDKDIRRWLVEAHKRIVNPLYNLLFALLGCTGLIVGNFNRRGQGKILTIAIASMVVVQACDLTFSNMANKNSSLIPLMYINLIIPTLIVLYFLLFYNPAYKAKKRQKVFA
ncbi:MAG: LPS export ABC transporter permease LptF [Lactobacillus sp.]|jgi:lipopolysaccharide export system permease protein|nr:LPS export ABC transporter permease LptF [Lactobacillus sp.]